MSEWDAALRAAEAALVAAQHAARDAVARRDDVQSQRDGMRESLASTRDRVSQTTYKIDSVRTLLASLEAQDENVRGAILELIPNAASAAESVRAAEGFEAALDTLLRDVSKATVVEDAGVAHKAIKGLRARGAGRGAFIVTEAPLPASGERDGVTGAAIFAVAGEGEVADAVRRAIPEAYIGGALQ